MEEIKTMMKNFANGFEKKVHKQKKRKMIVNRTEHPDTRYPKIDLNHKNIISLRLLEFGGVEGKFPVKIDDKTTVFIKNPTPTNIKAVKEKFKYLNKYGDTDVKNK